MERAWKGLVSLTKALGAKDKADRWSRDKEAQLKRICSTDAFKLCAEGLKERILDTDFYTSLGVTVRTERHEFQGQLRTVSDAVRDGERISDELKFKLIAGLHSFLVERFKPIIERNRAPK